MRRSRASTRDGTSRMSRDPNSFLIADRIQSRGAGRRNIDFENTHKTAAQLRKDLEYDSNFR